MNEPNQKPVTQEEFDQAARDVWGIPGQITALRQKIAELEKREVEAKAIIARAVEQNAAAIQEF